MRTSAVGLTFLSFMAGPLAAQDAGGPLSAIDWLSQSVAAPATGSSGGISVVIDEPPVTEEGGAMPSLVLIDGGIGQLRSAAAAL